MRPSTPQLGLALLERLTEKVYVHGGESEAEEAVVRAIGTPAAARHFVEYIQWRYGTIYRL